MNLASIRIITADLDRLLDFYASVTGVPPKRYTPDFAEVITPGGTLAIGSTRTLQFFGGDIASPAANRSVIIEFRVDDVDAEFDRHKEAIGGGLVQPPTDMPWGNRSLLFRDPDGNLVNFFTPKSDEALRRFER